MFKLDGNGGLSMKLSTVLTLVGFAVVIAIAWGVLTANVASTHHALSEHIKVNDRNWQEQRQVNREILSQLPKGD